MDRMNKKIIIRVLIGLGFLITVLMAIGEYQWRTQGLGVVIDRQKALGTVTNEYGIRDQDLALIQSSKFDDSGKRLLIKVAKDYQDQMLHSNDKEWILKNGRAIYIRGYCAIGYEVEKLKNKPSDPSILKKFYDNPERRILVGEFEANYYELDLSNESPSDEEERACYE